MAPNHCFHLSFTAALALFSFVSTVHYIRLTTAPPPSHRTSAPAPPSGKKAPPFPHLPSLPSPPPPPDRHPSPKISTGWKELFHDERYFREDYAEMNRSLKIFVYPHEKTDRFAHALLPTESDPTGNYASEGYFKKALAKSHFLTEDPSAAHLFFLPFSISALRNDRAVGVGGIPEFVRAYVDEVGRRYPYWNRSGGADHFYVCCHSAGRAATERAAEARTNAIQLVCSSNYFLPGYIPHKDASIPQVWPRKGPIPHVPSHQRKKLAFYAGAMNSPLRQRVVERWSEDEEMSVHGRRLSTPYADSLLSSKYCLHVKGFEVNTARVADAIFYGCVPVILADHYELPFTDVLDWTALSVVVPTADIPRLKDILRAKVRNGEYERMYRNVIRARKHFIWHCPPRDMDAFFMVMYQLWLRRHVFSTWPSD